MVDPCTLTAHPAVTDARRLTPVQYQNAVRAVFGGLVTPSTRYPGTYGASVTGYTTEPGLGLVGDQGSEQLMLAAEDVAEGVAAALPSLLPCSLTTANQACAGEFITQYARRAYRRAPTTEERQLLLETFQEGVASGASFSEATAMLVVHLLLDAAVPLRGRRFRRHGPPSEWS